MIQVIHYSMYKHSDGIQIWDISILAYLAIWAELQGIYKVSWKDLK